eukprot:4420720-Amphidinium_carterae.1
MTFRPPGVSRRDWAAARAARDSVPSPGAPPVIPWRLVGRLGYPPPGQAAGRADDQQSTYTAVDSASTLGLGATAHTVQPVAPADVSSTEHKRWRGGAPPQAPELNMSFEEAARDPSALRLCRCLVVARGSAPGVCCEGRCRESHRPSSRSRSEAGAEGCSSSPRIREPETRASGTDALLCGQVSQCGVEAEALRGFVVHQPSKSAQTSPRCKLLASNDNEWSFDGLRKALEVQFPGAVPGGKDPMVTQTKAKAKAKEAKMEARIASLCLMRSTTPANQLPRLRLRMNLPSCGNR